MVLASFGIAKPEDELRRLCDCTIFGTTAVGLVYAARTLGFGNSRKFSIDLTDLKDFTIQGCFPIVYVVLSPGSPTPDVHAFVVLSVSDINDEISVIDPKRGNRLMAASAFSAIWSPMKNLTVVIAK